MRQKRNIEPAKFSAEDHASDVTWLTGLFRLFRVYSKHQLQMFISFFTEKCLVQTIQILTQAISVFPGKGTENAREILA